MKPLSILILFVLIFSIAACDSDGSYMGDYTTEKPGVEDIVGTYMFYEQTIHESFDFKEAPTSKIILKSDGSFVANNILNLAADKGEYISKDGLITVAGKWRLAVDSVNTSWGSKKAHWGVALTPAPESIQFVGFLGSSSPHKLIISYDEPDLDQVMIFIKK